MKKFNEAEIYMVNMEPIVGGRLGDWLQQLMKNQNEIIEFFEYMDSISMPIFAEWNRKKENGK